MRGIIRVRVSRAQSKYKIIQNSYARCSVLERERQSNGSGCDDEFGGYVYQCAKWQARKFFHWRLLMGNQEQVGSRVEEGRTFVPAAHHAAVCTSNMLTVH